jgi:hypothetical protein
MQNNFNNVKFLTKFTTLDYQSFLDLPPLSPFSNDVIDYLNTLSKELNKDKLIRQYPDVSAFSFFCRRANITILKKRFSCDEIIKFGRGMVFHITPSNIPVNFAFSLILGLLSGNTNIVKISSKNFKQIDIIINAINKLTLVPQLSNISDRIVIIRYENSNNITAKLSLDCDVRIIWGGDDTIKLIRSNSLKPQAFDITFADRFSICAINADNYLNALNKEKIATDFYNDTYLFDQNSCTSPHLVIWIGIDVNIAKAKSIFWNKLHAQVKRKKYKLNSISAIDKLTNFYNQAINFKNIKLEYKEDNLIWRVLLTEVRDDLDMFRCNSGYFMEYHASSISDLSKIVNKKYQTLAYYGFSKEELINAIKQSRPKGIDRIVPIGRTMDFSLLWDGYDSIGILTRNIDVV